MRVKCNNCGETYDLPDVKREHLEHAFAIADALSRAHQSHVTRALVGVLLLRQVCAVIGLGPVMISAVAEAYSTIVQRAGASKRHPTLRVVN